MAVTVVEASQSVISGSINPVTVDVSAWSTPQAGDVVVVAYAGFGSRVPTAVSGLGATWTITPLSTGLIRYAIGTGATSSGTITVTQNSTGIAQLAAYLVRGLSASTAAGNTVSTTSGSSTGPTAVSAGNGQIAFVGMRALTTGVTFPDTETPSGGWTYQAAVTSGSTAEARHGYRIPTGAQTNHVVTASGGTSLNKNIAVIVVGTYSTGSTPVSVAAPVLAVVEDVLNPAVTAGATATVAAPALAVAADVLNPTVSAGHGVTVGAPALALVAALLAPTVSAPAAVTVSAPALAVAVEVPTPTVVTASGTTVIAPTLDLTTVLPSPTVSAGSSVAVPAPVLALTFAAPAPDVTTAVPGSPVSVAAPVAGLTFAMPEPAVTGVLAADKVVLSLTHTPVGIIHVLPLVPSTELDEAEPVLRVSHQMPNLDAAHPAYTARVDYPVVKDVVGHVHLWIAGQDVTYFRDVPTVIRRWESEAPFGDTAAAFEFPQLNPWDKPGEGDLDFLYPDAPVAIGINEEVAEGVFRVRRLWSGFLDARGNGLAGEREDYAWEAKGTFWQAQSNNREPHAITDPVDIGVWIARVLNAVDGRRWKAMPLTPIGITTMTRGSRDDMAMEYVQALLSEAITDDLRQWTLVEVAPGVPRLVLKPAPSTVHATVAYGTPGVDIDLRIDESTRVDRIFMRGIGPKMGGWANVHYPWIGLFDQAPPYPMAELTDYIVLNSTDADTVTGSGVTDFQRRVDELEGFANPAVSGVMSAAWMAVVDDLQRRLHISVGPLGPQTWERVFDGRPNAEALKARRLPMASKPEAEKYLYTAEGKRLPGVNPLWDGRIPRDVGIDVGTGKTKAEGFKLARKLLGIYGEASAYGTIEWTFDPNETDRTRLSHLSNIKVTGHEGTDRVLQVSSKSVELENGETGPQYVVTTRVDERARDAMAVEDLLEQRRSAQADPSRRPGNPSKASRQVSDQRVPWDSESVCGVLRRTAVNGASGLWTIKILPFAEVGKLAGIRLRSDRPFMFAIFASLRITENKLASRGDPWASEDFWRDNKAYFDEYGIIEAWGQKDQACGYSPKAETAIPGGPGAGPFTGDFVLDTPVDYWTEEPPAVAVAIYMRGGSGWIDGHFIPAYEN